jgi:hypothetical protein
LLLRHCDLLPANDKMYKSYRYHPETRYIGWFDRNYIQKKEKIKQELIKVLNRKNNFYS